MPYISVCKNVIASNNKRDWKDPEPAIRVSNTPSGKVSGRGSRVNIMDRNGEIVATVISTTDGKPVIKCGAKVAVITEYPVEVVE